MTILIFIYGAIVLLGFTYLGKLKDSSAEVVKGLIFAIPLLAYPLVADRFNGLLLPLIALLALVILNAYYAFYQKTYHSRIAMVLNMVILLIIFVVYVMQVIYAETIVIYS